MKINVYIGVIGSGKDFQSEKECNITLSYAENLRKDMWTILGWSPKSEIEYEKFKVSKFNLNINENYLSVSGRQLLQNYGTELMRAKNTHYWSKRLIEEINTIYFDNVHDVIGIADARFDTEIKDLIYFVKNHQYIKLNFIHCTYKSEKYNENCTHESEKLAQKYLNFKGTNKEFTELIIKTYK